jgi:hypothetical protein
MVKPRGPEIMVWKKRNVFQWVRGSKWSGPPEMKHITSYGQLRARSNRPNYVRLSEGMGAQWWELSNHQYADQARTAKGKNVVVCDEFRNKMMKPQNPGTRKWKENIRLKPVCRIKLNSSMLIEKYIRQQLQQKRPQGQQRGG